MASAARASQFGSFVQGGGKFLWITSSGRPCTGPMGGCAARNEVVAGLDEWVGRGLPRTGATFCGGSCYCMVVPMLDFGLGVSASLDIGDVGFDLAAAKNDQRGPGKPFAEVERYDPEDFAADLAGMPLVGRTRRKIEELLAEFESGGVPFETARLRADQILGLK